MVASNRSCTTCSTNNSIARWRWQGPEFPNNTKGADGKVPDYNDFSFNCSSLPGGGCLFDLSKDPTGKQAPTYLLVPPLCTPADCQSGRAWLCVLRWAKHLTRTAVDRSAEHDELSSAQPAKLATLLAAREAAQAKVFSPDRGPVDRRACEAATGKYAGFWGPWLDEP